MSETRTTPRRPLHIHKDYPYLNDVSADPRLLGYPAILNPLVDKVSGSRLDMFSSHRAQALVIKGSQFPDIFSGFEKTDSEYTFNSTRRTQDIEVLAVIPRYASMRGVPGIATPYITVIYRGLDDKKIDYFDAKHYELGSDGYGFEYDWKTVQNLEPGRFVPKEEVVACTPSIKGSKYGIGLNLPTCYMTVHECIEDAMWISESAAKAMETTELRKVVINIPQEARPLNLYGNANEFKVFPDIGEYVNEDGIFCAFRNVSTTTCAADTEPSQMSQVNMLTDDIVMIPVGSQVIDIEFVVNRFKYNPSYEQVEKYHRATLDYWRKIYDFYQQNAKKTEQLGNQFSTLVATAIKRLVAGNVKLPGYSDSIKGKTEYEGVDRQPVEYIQAVVTFKRVRHVTVGFKLTDICGGF